MFALFDCFRSASRRRSGPNHSRFHEPAAVLEERALMAGALGVIAQNERITVAANKTVDITPLILRNDVGGSTLRIVQVRAPWFLLNPITTTNAADGIHIQYSSSIFHGIEVLNYTVQDSNGNTDSAWVTIEVENSELDPAPEFNSPLQHFFISPGTAAGTVIGRLTATDIDFDPFFFTSTDRDQFPQLKEETGDAVVVTGPGAGPLAPAETLAPFTVTASGDVIYTGSAPLANGEVYSRNVMVYDGRTLVNGTSIFNGQPIFDPNFAKLLIHVTTTPVPPAIADDLVARERNNVIHVGRSRGDRFIDVVAGAWPQGEVVLDQFAGDINGDGRSDLIGRMQSGRWVGQINTGTGFNAISLATIAGSQNWVDLQVGDFNGDGRADITARDPVTGIVWVGRSTGSALGFNQWATWALGSWFDVRVGDFNGDGRDDLFARRGSKRSEWYISFSISTSFQHQFFGNIGSSTYLGDPLIGDFNGDGIDDVFVRRVADQALIVVRRIAGQMRSFRFATLTFPGINPQDFRVGDFNNDGRADVYHRNLLTNQLFVALANTTGTAFTVTSWGFLDDFLLTPADVVVGDYNGDGRSDVAVRRADTPEWHVALSTGAAFNTTCWGVWGQSPMVSHRQGRFLV